MFLNVQQHLAKQPRILVSFSGPLGTHPLVPAKTETKLHLSVPQYKFLLSDSECWGINPFNLVLWFGPEIHLLLPGIYYLSLLIRAKPVQLFCKKTKRFYLDSFIF